MYYIWSKSFYLLLLWNFIFNHSLSVWTSVLYDTHASPATALHWLYLSRRGNRHSQWAWCYSLDGFSSTHTLLILSDDEDISEDLKSSFRLNKTSKNAKNGNCNERTSQKGLSSRASGSCSTTPMGPHYPHAVHIDGSPLPPWVNSCGSFCIVYLLISAFCELHFQIFQTLAVLSRGVARLILSPRPLNPFTKTCSAWAIARRKKIY